jgi:L-lactate dehydrogenase complex protein LldG
MKTREKILQAVLDNQPAATSLPDISMYKGETDNLIYKFCEVFKNIGGIFFLVNDIEGVKKLIIDKFDNTGRFITTLPELSDYAELLSTSVDPHSFENVELAVIKAHFSVAENGALWFTEDLMGQRIVPYICQHLAVVISAKSIVPTLHEAYELIGAGDYGFGGFISGPSKTADIEQALVLGAHGPLTMTVFILP